MADSREWVDLGNDAWDSDSVYRVYKSLQDEQLQSTHGPHLIAHVPASEAGKIQRAFLDGAAATGFPIVQDLNATGAEGAGSSPVCRRGDCRVSAANTFTDPIRDLPNLSIMPDSQVDKVLFSDRRASGVLLVSGQHLQASHEVIVCAGAIFPPAMLQRSGIGPSRLLE